MSQSHIHKHEFKVYRSRQYRSPGFAHPTGCLTPDKGKQRAIHRVSAKQSSSGSINDATETYIRAVEAVVVSGEAVGVGRGPVDLHVGACEEWGEAVRSRV